MNEECITRFCKIKKKKVEWEKSNRKQKVISLLGAIIFFVQSWVIDKRQKKWFKE